jgi:anti-anti-sigma factor
MVRGMQCLHEMTIRIGNRIAELPKAADDIGEFGARHGVPRSALHALLVSLDEVLSNTIKYAYRDDERHEIVVRVFLTPGEIVAEVEDDGVGFDPLSVPPPDLSGGLAERRLGGIGLHLVRSLMDNLEYFRDGDRNRLRIGKRLEAVEEKMEIDDRLAADVTIVDVKGRIDSASAGELGDRLAALFQTARTRVVLDLAHVDYISSAGFRTLLIGRRMAENVRGMLALCRLSPEVRKLFDISNFSELFQIYAERPPSA